MYEQLAFPLRVLYSEFKAGGTNFRYNYAKTNQNQNEIKNK